MLLPLVGPRPTSSLPLFVNYLLFSNAQSISASFHSHICNAYKLQNHLDQLVVQSAPWKYGFWAHIQASEECRVYAIKLIAQITRIYALMLQMSVLQLLPCTNGNQSTQQRLATIFF